MLNVLNGLAPLLMLTFSYLVAVFFGESINPFSRPREPVLRRRFRLFRGLCVVGVLATIVGSVIWYSSLGQDLALPSTSVVGWLGAYSLTWVLLAIVPGVTYFRNPHAGKRSSTWRHPAVATGSVAAKAMAVDAAAEEHEAGVEGLAHSAGPGHGSPDTPPVAEPSRMNDTQEIDTEAALAQIDALPPLEEEPSERKATAEVVP